MTMAESFAANNEIRFRSPKTGEEESKLLQGSILKSTAYKTKWVLKIFQQWQLNSEVKGPVLHTGGTFKDYGDLCKVQIWQIWMPNCDIKIFANENKVNWRCSSLIIMLN